ncbi:MAG: hypothetical protein AB8B80_09055 [Marinicellaceae bacterium]
MSHITQKLKVLIIASLLASGFALAEDCPTDAEKDVVNVKPTTMTSQKPIKSSASKNNLLKNSKNTKFNSGYFDVLKLLIPAGLR